MKLQIPAKALRAAVHCSSKKDVRYYLNGVLLDVTGPTEGYVAATDGAVLFAGHVRLEYLEEPQSKPYQIIIPIEVCEKLTKRVDWYVLESLPDGRYTIDGKIFTAIDGKFPEYWRVIPTQQDAIKREAPGQFNPELLKRCGGAITEYYQLSRGRSLDYGFLQCGTSAGVVYGEDALAVAVIMPQNSRGFDYNYHGLLSPTQSFEQAA